MHETIEIFIHPAGGKPQIATVEASDTIAQALAKAGITVAPDDHLFVAGSDDDNAEVVGEDDQDEPVPHSTRIGDAGLTRHSHVHCHRCRRIEVTVRKDDSKTRKFAPTARVARVRRWALKAFGLSGQAASDFVLQLCDSDIRPRPNQHLSELTQPGMCSICFELVKEITPQG